MGTGTPSSSTRSVSGTTRRPRIGTTPLTVIRPSTMSCSHTRRDPIPMRARTFWSRSPSDSGSAPSGISSGTPHRAHLVLEGVEGLWPREQILHRWELVEPVEAQSLEEGVGGGIEGSLSWTGSPPHRRDIAPVLKQADHTVHVDAPEGGDLGPGDRLLVGHDGQRLECRRRQAGGDA